MRPILKYGGFGFLSLGAVAVLGVGTIHVAAEGRLNRTWHVTPAPVSVSDDSVVVERGRHLVLTKGCGDCHGEDLGGSLFIDGMPMARLWASNLTPGAGGLGGTYGVEDWVRAIRHGVGPDGRPLLFMPSSEYPLSDEDLGAMVSYLRTVPPVDRELGENAVGPVGRALFLKGDLPLLHAELIDHEREDWSAPQAGPTAAYGEYLATGCTGCHGSEMVGGKIPGTPPDWKPASNLTPHAVDGIGGWTEEDFVRVLRTGRRPDGTQVDDIMPWRATAHYTDEELRAMWLYLRSIPARAGGA